MELYPDAKAAGRNKLHKVGKGTVVMEQEVTVTQTFDAETIKVYRTSAEQKRAEAARLMAEAESIDAMLVDVEAALKG